MDELLGTKIANPMACDFLQRWTSLAAIKKCRDSPLEAFYTQHQVRSRTKIEARIALIRESVPLVEDAAIVETSALKVKSHLSSKSAGRKGPKLQTVEIDYALHRITKPSLLDVVWKIGLCIVEA